MRRGSLPGMPCQFEIPSFKGKNVQNAPPGAPQGKLALPPPTAGNAAKPPGIPTIPKPKEANQASEEESKASSGKTPNFQSSVANKVQ